MDHSLKSTGSPRPPLRQAAKNRAFAWVLIAVWGAIMLWNLFLPPRDFSEAENRSLTPFPQYSFSGLADGRFTQGINGYLNDHFPGRDAWLGGKNLMEYLLGKREIAGVYIGDDALFGHLLPENPVISDLNITGAKEFAAASGIPTTILLVPGAASVQPERLPAFAEGWDEARYIAEVYAALGDDLTTVDIFDTLRSHRDEYIFYRTDHHWTTYGAWLSYSRLAPALGLSARSRQDFVVSTLSDDFYGTYHSKTGLNFTAPDVIECYESGGVDWFEVCIGVPAASQPDYNSDIYFKPGSPLGYIRYSSAYFPDFLQHKDQFSYFFGQVQPFVTVHTHSESGKKLIIFKDSYAHCLAPMLFEDYSEIRLVDLRYFTSLDYAGDLGFDQYDQALFLYGADVFGHELTAGKLI